MTEEQILARKLIKWGSIVLVAFIALLTMVGTIDAGERGVHTRLGNVIGVKGPGLYVKMPWPVEKVQTMSIKTQSVLYEREEPLAAASRDLQDVQIATVVNYHLVAEEAGQVYTQYGSFDTWEEQVIRPAVRDTVKAIASQYTAEELVTKRPEFTEVVLAKLNERLASKHAFVEQVNITNFQFSESFSKAIEAKVTAEQEALASKNKLEQVKFEAQQQVEKAKAEAEAIRIQAQAITQQGGAEYVRLKLAEKWNGVLPTQMVPDSALPFINIR